MPHQRDGVEVRTLPWQPWLLLWLPWLGVWLSFCVQPRGRVVIHNAARVFGSSGSPVHGAWRRRLAGLRRRNLPPICRAVFRSLVLQAVIGRPPSDDQGGAALRRFVDDSVDKDVAALAQRQTDVELHAPLNRQWPTIRFPPRSYAEALARQPPPCLRAGQLDSRALPGLQFRSDAFGSPAVMGVVCGSVEDVEQARPWQSALGVVI